MVNGVRLLAIAQMPGGLNLLGHSLIDKEAFVMTKINR